MKQNMTQTKKRQRERERVGMKEEKSENYSEQGSILHLSQQFPKQLIALR